MSSSKKSSKHIPFAEKMLQQMGCAIFLRPSKVWLDTGYSYLNAVLGSKKYGLPAGKLFGIQGRPHAGKTSLVMFLAALAQKLFNAFVIWVDLETHLPTKMKVVSSITHGQRSSS